MAGSHNLLDKVKEAGLQAANVAAAGALTQSAAYTQTQDALTDSSGGTPATTLAAGTNLAELTNGLPAGDATLVDIVPTAAITDNSGGSDPGDDTIAVVTNSANAGSADVAPVTAAIAQLAAKANVVTTALGALEANQGDIAAQLVVQRTLNGVLLNHVASLAAQLAKIKADGAAYLADLAEIKVDTAALRTTLNAEIAAVKAASLQASS